MRYIVFLLVLVVCACSVKNKVALEGETYDIDIPPNTVEVSPNFFVDKTEISNINYDEYVYWLGRIYGKESQIYKDAYPDTLVWQEIVEYGDPFPKDYYKNARYDYHAVVGVSLSQAKKYTAWRTERVVEMSLVKKGWIEFNRNENQDNFFTVKKYLDGAYHGTRIQESYVVVPRYKIPTVEEWEMLAGKESGYMYGTDSLSRYNKKILKQYHCLYNIDNYSGDIENAPSFIPTHMPNVVNSLSQNIYGLYGVIGNVAELDDTPNVVKGGSWRHKIKDIDISRNEVYKKPTCWIGFRNVCKFEIVHKS